ncbi:integrin alpha M, partial [Chelydra serpentina]
PGHRSQQSTHLQPPRMGPLRLLIYLCTVLAPSRGFSVDVEGPITFQEAARGFGQSVVEFGSASAGGLLVGAPLQTGNVNETGKVYKCDPGSRRCQEIPIQRPPDAVNMSLGLSLAAQGPISWCAAPRCTGPAGRTCTSTATASSWTRASGSSSASQTPWQSAPDVPQTSRSSSTARAASILRTLER